jgi:hypothetical protein
VYYYYNTASLKSPQLSNNNATVLNAAAVELACKIIQRKDAECKK